MVNQALSLIGTGIMLGIVHVLTGPDHLSAIATLTANVADINTSFWLGVRWGIGHSTGLLTVAIVFILLSLSSDNDSIEIPDEVGHFFEALIGIFMLLLGAYGVRRAWKRQLKVFDSSSYGAYGSRSGGEMFENPLSANDSDESQQLQEHELQQTSETLQQEQRSQMEQIASYQHSTKNRSSSSSTGRESETRDYRNDVESEFEDETSTIDDESQRRRMSWKWRCLEAMTRKISTRAMALFAGVLHGLAGPGGVLGIVPAVQLHSAKWASLYLGTFCLSSTLTMGLFAALYGSCSSRVARGRRSTERRSAAGDGEEEFDNEDGDVLVVTQSPTAPAPSNRDFWIECLSACLSILVGITWLVLLSIGKLDEVFP